MKYLIYLITAFSFYGILARAEIPVPPPPAAPNYNEIVLQVNGAAQLYKALLGVEHLEKSLHTATSSIMENGKVWRASSGLSQIVCHHTHQIHRAPPLPAGLPPPPHPLLPTDTYSCSVTQSKDGKPVPQYFPHGVAG